ncbi:3-isopropylmalate dehydratase [Amycolatopsis acidicola]|uniref:3-isopropylmalate dehydratase small subunit n=1 Tax=Amycolatopsis acidicola TaxID=2596893 RepID=A0A5N0V2C3_9PSEU|nr:3-isopropylmalate dehydratase [Amycolatopsis acidicola]KAA9159095.1 3-isopropylmalate dehydratase [Amycolatopsis acidicola]
MSSTISGRVWVFGDSLNTDAMYPAFAMKMDIPEAARHVFYEVRPGWTDQVRPGDIVVAGKNFGVGSSRPVAALFRQLKVAALVAEEFNSLFLRNAINSGLPALTVPGATDLFSDGDFGRFDIATGDYANETTGIEGRTAPLPPLVLEILASGGVLARLAEQGYLPIELLDTLKSGALPQGGGA